MEMAVSAKNYAEAEHFRVRLTELAEEKALAIEKEQHSNNPSSPLDPVAQVGRLFSLQFDHSTIRVHAQHIWLYVVVSFLVRT